MKYLVLAGHHIRVNILIFITGVRADKNNMPDNLIGNIEVINTKCKCFSRKFGSRTSVNHIS